jgi:hypothetical protein
MADRNRVSVSDIFQDAIAMKMFQSVLDPEDIMEDWSWNLDDGAGTGWREDADDTLGTSNEEVEAIFNDWRWHVEDDSDEKRNDGMKVRFYDTLGINEGFNDFNYWRREPELANLFPLDEDAWLLWTEWGSVDEILGNTLEAELPLDQEEEEVADDPRLLRLEEFHLPMKRLRTKEEEDDHWSLWTEWGSVDEILDNTLEVGDVAEDIENADIVAKDEDIDSGFLGDTEEDANNNNNNAMMDGGGNFWEETYDNESILRSLMDDEVVDETADNQPGGCQPVAYWDESRRDNREILAALLREESPRYSKKRKFQDDDMILDDEEEDDNIIFEEDGAEEETSLPKEPNILRSHMFWEPSGGQTENYAEKAVAEENGDESGLCSCESGIFWLSTEDNRMIAESLVAEPSAATTNMVGTALWENGEIARALVAGDHEPKALIGGDSEPKALIGGKERARSKREPEDYFQDWRRNLSSPKKSR